MSDKPREWPNKAKWQRDQALMAASSGIHALEIVFDEVVTETDRIRREAQALHELHTIKSLMIEAGAQTKE
mgnify:CR=1 FL=1